MGLKKVIEVIRLRSSKDHRAFRQKLMGFQEVVSDESEMDWVNCNRIIVPYLNIFCNEEWAERCLEIFHMEYKHFQNSISIPLEELQSLWPLKWGRKFNDKRRASVEIEVLNTTLTVCVCIGNGFVSGGVSVEVGNYDSYEFIYVSEPTLERSIISLKAELVEFIRGIEMKMLNV